jgi:Icc-related predicted phosphoesterase
MSITLLAVADEISPLLYDHFSPDRWQAIDLIISCGDLAPDYLDFLASSLTVPVLYVRGNHDCVYPLERYDGCENIHGRIVCRRGQRIAGFEGSRRYHLGGCQYTETEMKRVVRRSRLRARFTGRPDIVITHAPPAGCHDGADVAHRGFECFRDLIRVWQPSYFIHGHTHAYERGELVTQVGATTVINAYPYRVIELMNKDAQAD